MVSPQERGVGNEVERTRPTCVVLGGFRFKDKIDEVIDEFETAGISVLAPNKGKVVKIDPEWNYAILDTDVEDDPLKLVAQFMECLTRADFIYIVNPGGYIGLTVASEMGFAMGRGLPLYTMELLDINDPDLYAWQMFCGIAKTHSPTEVIAMAKEGRYNLDDQWWYKEDRKPLKFEVVERDDPDAILGNRAIIRFEVEE